MKARETEFDGVVFRSRNEAMFAYMLQQTYCIWAYEPGAFSTDIYTPDFHFIKDDLSCVVELKPSKVTDTYKKELLTRFKEMRAKACTNSFCLIEWDIFSLGFVSASLLPSAWIHYVDNQAHKDHAFIDVFSERGEFDPDCDKVRFILGCMAKHKQDARNYRFDLVNPASND